MKPTNPWIVLICTLLFTYCLPSRAALVEDDFSVDLRRWIGDTSAFTLQHGELRTNSTKSHTRFFIATEFQGQQHMMWETTIRLDFATSSANFVDWVLHSDRSEIDGNYNGYFLRIGDKYDHIALYRRNGQQITLLAQTERDITHHFSGRIHCAFHNNGWSVYIKDDKTNVVQSLNVLDSARLNAVPSYTGFLIQQSSTSFHKKHYFDDYLVDTFERDFAGPKALRVDVQDSIYVRIEFDEPILISTSQIRINSAYVFAEIAITANALQIHLARPLRSGQNTLVITGVHDMFSNPSDSVFDLLYRPPKLPEAFGLLITEIMADPSPPQGLRETEYLELFNGSSDTINLQYIRLQVDDKEIRLPSYLLVPEAYVVLSETLVYNNTSDSTNMLFVDGLPSLPNSGGRIQVLTYAGLALFEVHYSLEQHSEPWKRSGGWSLEMKDVKQPCVLNNWESTKNSLGGSPGMANRGHGEVVDTIAPHVIGAVAREFRIGVAWNEPLLAYQPSAYDVRMTPKLDIAEVHTTNDTLWVFFNQALTENQVYQVHLSDIHDCSGNFIDTMVRVSLSTGRPVHRVVISEVLFDTDGQLPEFVEITNLSEHVVNTNQLVLERLVNGARYDFWALPEGVLPPGESCVLTRTLSEGLLNLLDNRRFQVVLGALPSLPNHGVELRLSMLSGQALDVIDVRASYHNPWIANPQNVSLERISLQKSGLDSANWTSASGPFYASPGTVPMHSGRLTATSRLQILADPITPDGDGYHDFAQLTIEGKSNSSADLVVCNVWGSPIVHLLKDVPLGSSTQINWYATDHRGTAVPAGIYVIVLRIIIDGTEHVEKHPITICYPKGF